jgi:hypothetical protein
MKNLTLSLMAVLVMLAFFPTDALARRTSHKVTTYEVTTAGAVQTQESANPVMARLDEIKAMDFSSLNSSEKRQLRRELRSLKGQLNDFSGGVLYISGGTLLILILLLILLF